MNRVVARALEVVPVTWLGILVGAVSVFALQVIGRAQQDLIILVAGYVGIAILALSIVSVVVATLLIKLRLRRFWPDGAHMKLETQTATYTGQSVASWSWFPLVNLSWQWVSPLGCQLTIEREGGQYRERVTAEERGVFHAIERRVVVADVMGLSRIALRHHQHAEVEISPCVGKLGKTAVLHAYMGGEDLVHPYGLPEGDRIDLIRYAPGDPARLIHWKLYARTRKLLRRTPERSLSITHRVVAYLVTGQGDDASAGAARVTIAQGGLGEDWVFSADGLSEAAETETRALYLVRCSKSVQHDGPSRLHDFVRRHTHGQPTSVLIFVPPVMREDWLRSLVMIAREHDGPLRVIVGIDQGAASAARRSVKRWLFKQEPRVEETDRVMLELGRHRIDAVLIERQTGNVYTSLGRVPNSPRQVA
ncbi:MAG: DUF58 domain-containing protein [Myxococcales bacterium]|nr:DUF58 domain-containing protein [Myxococcales bacterium]MCB9709006.1 DUF58 domain-containing protein [Myxococcales bacterium]